MATEDRRVLISGGGPVGLLCAWLLGRKGIPVRLFDENDSPQADPRAATTHPATLDLLSDDGLADEMARVGLVAPIFQFWDRPTDSLVAEFDHAILKNDTQASVRRAMRAVQDLEAAAEADREARERRGDARPHRDRRHAGRQLREPDRARPGRRHDPQGRLRHRRRRRPQHRAQAIRHRVRRLHLARALHRVHDAVRFRGQARLLLPQLLRRPRRVVQLLQGLGRRPARTVAHGLPDRLHDAGGGTDQRRRGAGADAEILPGAARLRGRSTAISM